MKCSKWSPAMFGERVHTSECLWVRVWVWQKKDSEKDRRCARERERLQPDSVSGSLEWHTTAETVSAPLRSMVSWLLLGREQSGNIVLQPDREMKSKIHSCGWPRYCTWCTRFCITWCIPYYLHPQEQELCQCAEMRKKKVRAAKKKNKKWVVIHCCYDLACAEGGVFLISKVFITWQNSLLIKSSVLKKCAFRFSNKSVT